MAYDPNKAADVAALKTELTTDPVVMGYDLMKAKQAAKLLNDVASNTAPATVQRKFTEVRLEELWAEGIIDEVEYTALTNLQKAKLDGIFARDAQQFMTEDTRLFFRNTFGNGSTTFGTNITGLRTLDASRADVLWGYGSNITKANVLAALES